MWFIYALVFALVTSVSTIIAKKILKELDEYFYLGVSTFFALPFLFTIIVYFYQIPSIDIVFIVSVLVSVVIGVFAAVFAYRAIKISEISLIGPISAFNPVFTSLVSFLLLGEKIDTEGALGILLICIGAYLLQLSKKRKSFWDPIISLFSDYGVRLSLLAYFLWAITPIFEKTAIQHTFPQIPPFASFAGMIGLNIVYLPLIMKFSRNKRKQIKRLKNFIPILLGVGLLGGIGQTSAYMAFSLTNLGYATAIFKFSTVFTVVLGWLLFKEHNIKARLSGSLVMLLGLYLLLT